MIVIVGSGPAGIAAAHALVEKGVAVTMLDVGISLEPERESVISHLSSLDKEQWPPDELNGLRENLKANLKGIPLKLSYGSDYPHRDVGQLGTFRQEGVKNPVVSSARGGFSTIWGSQFMPNFVEDMADWCISRDDLEPHYRAVLRFVPLSARHDDLEEVVPLYTESAEPLTPSRQAQRFLDTLAKNKEALRRGGFIAGMSRLVVQAKPTEANPRGCVYCGLCMHGCPYKLVYSAAYGLESLLRSPYFRYIPDVILDRVVEKENTVTLQCRDRATNAPKEYQASRVFLACGAVSTTRILMESLGIYDTDVIVRDSVRFLMPMLHYDYTPGVMQEALHTLGQVNVLLQQDSLSKHRIHLQYYMYNDHFVASLKGALGPLFPVARPFLPLLFGRLSVAFGWMHSDDCAPMTVRLEKRGETSEYIVRTATHPRTKTIVDGVIAHMMRHQHLFRAVPIAPAVQIMKPGDGYHYGASFPMSSHPTGVQSDRLGRPVGLQRVHAIDGTVLPAITSATFSFTIMANAHRIATAVAPLIKEERAQGANKSGENGLPRPATSGIPVVTAAETERV